MDQRRRVARTPSDPPQQQRLIWLPDPDDAAIQQGLRELGPSPRNQHKKGPHGSPPVARGTFPGYLPQALATFHGVPANRDNLLDEIDALLQRQSQLNLINIGQLLSSLDLSVSMVELPIQQLSRVPCPAVFIHQGHITLLEGMGEDGQLRLLDPELGPLTLNADVIQPEQDDRLPILPLRRRPDSKEQRFSWAWYALPAPPPRELIEVLVILVW